MGKKSTVTGMQGLPLTMSVWFSIETGPTSSPTRKRPRDPRVVVRPPRSVMTTVTLCFPI